MAGFFSKIKNLFTVSDVSEEFYEELEEILITSDIGVRTTMDIIEHLQEQVDELGLKAPMEYQRCIRLRLTVYFTFAPLTGTAL